jgi:hypothetical protein
MGRSRRRGALLLAGLIALPLGAQEAPRLAFKGLLLGASQAEAVERLPFLQCRTVGAGATVVADVICNSTDGGLVQHQFTFGGVPPSYVSLSFVRDQMVSATILFYPRDFDRLQVAMTEAYGKPAKAVTETVKTRAGLALENNVLEWTAGGDTLMLRRYGSDIRTGAVMLSGKAFEQEDERRRRERASSGAKDL